MEWARVKRIERIGMKTPVYNLECDPHRNFFANGVLTHNCDTKYSWEPGLEMSIDDIIKEVKKYAVKNVCITGGEPLLQRETVTLTNKLLSMGYHIVVETGGSLSIQELATDENLSVSLDIKCPSSGMQDKMDFSNIELLGPTDQLKFVIADEEDYKYAKKILKQHNPGCEVVFQPEGGTKMLPLAEWVLRDGLNVRVLPQLHRVIWGDKKGV